MSFFHDFTPMPKTPRLDRSCVITEKLDGTNASIHIKPVTERPKTRDVVCPLEPEAPSDSGWLVVKDGKAWVMAAASRNRWLMPASISGDKSTDNYGFAAWAYEHASELVDLGEGSHFGEWYGSGIQRGYGLKDRVFALFNVNRWKSYHHPWSLDMVTGGRRGADAVLAPACVDVVPVLGVGDFYSTNVVNDCFEMLANFGSFARAQHYKKPEGIMVFHSASRQLFKMTYDLDKQGKGV